MLERITGHQLGVELAALVELHRRQAQALLLDLGGVGREAAGDHAADVGPVAGVGEPAEEAAGAEERLDELHVHEVRAAEVGIVEDVDVALLRRPCPALADGVDHGGHGVLHRADEDRQAQLPLRDQLAGVGGVEAVGAVVRLGDHGAEGGAGERQVHLVADLDEAVADDGEGDGVEGHGRASVAGGAGAHLCSPLRDGPAGWGDGDRD
jgi:hypothetical protein